MSNGARGGSAVTVTITLDRESGHVLCEPNPVFVRPGQRVEWSCAEGPWAVHPVALSPFDRRSIQGEKGEPAGAVPAANASFGRYEYLVAVAADGKVWTEDPEIIFEPRR